MNKNVHLKKSIILIYILLLVELRQLLIFLMFIVLLFCFYISFTFVLLPFKSVLHLGFKHQYAIIENPHTSRYTGVMLIKSLMTCYSRLP